MREEIKEFLVLLESPAQGDDLEKLARALDRLANAVHDLPSQFDERELPNPPDADYKRFYALAAAAYPQLGCYRTCDPVEDEVSEPMIADAADDLPDIACDMTNILWRLENNGRVDAAWHARFGYRMHWGAHLHNLRVCIHAKMNK